MYNYLAMYVAWLRYICFISGGAGEFNRSL